MTRGELWWLEEPSRGRRPACILTRDAAIPVLSRVIVVPATRTVRGIPTELALDEGDGAPEPCVLSFDNIRVVRKSLLTERIGNLSLERAAQLCEKLKLATGC